MSRAESAALERKLSHICLVYQYWYVPEGYSTVLRKLNLAIAPALLLSFETFEQPSNYYAALALRGPHFVWHARAVKQDEHAGLRDNVEPRVGDQLIAAAVAAHAMHARALAIHCMHT